MGINVIIWSHRTTLRFALRAAATSTLKEGWLYLPNGDLSLDTECLLLQSDAEEDQEAIAAALGFPKDGLDTDLLEGTVEVARQFESVPSDELLFESFIYYWHFDAWLPQPDAPDPPRWEETKARMDREFYLSLGKERLEVPCRKHGCARGAVRLSVHCRVHHFEMIKREPCPFAD